MKRTQDDFCPPITSERVTDIDDAFDDYSFVRIGAGISSRISSLAELFVEWYLFDAEHPETQKKLTQIFNEKQFTDLACGMATLCEDLVGFIHTQIPFFIQIDKVYRLNRLAKHNRNSYEIKVSDVRLDELKIFIEQQMAEQAEERRIRYIGYSTKYRENNKDEINARRRKKRELHGEEVRAKQREYVHRPDVVPRVKAAQKKYRDANRDEVNRRERERRAKKRPEINAAERERYAQNIEHCRELARKNSKNYAQRHPEKVRATRKRCYASYRLAHLEELAEYKHKYNQENKEKIAQQKRLIREQTKQLAIGCPAFIFIRLLKKQSPAVYLSLFGKYQNPAIAAIKSCPTMPDVNFTLCPILQNPNMSEPEMLAQCPLLRSIQSLNPVAQIRQIACDTTKTR